MCEDLEEQNDRLIDALLSRIEYLIVYTSGKFVSSQVKHDIILVDVWDKISTKLNIKSEIRRFIHNALHSS